MQIDTASLIGDATIVAPGQRIEKLLGWAWRVGLVIAAILATPAATGAPRPVDPRPQGTLEFTFTSVANQTAALAVAEDGSKQIVVKGNDESTALTLSITGRTDETTVDLRVNAERDTVVTLGYESGNAVTLNLTAQPYGADVTMNVDSDSEYSVRVVDPSTERVGVSVGLNAVETSSAMTIVWDQLPAEASGAEEGRITPQFPGFLNEDALGGSVTLTASGLTIESVAVVSLHYAAADAIGLNESDLHVHRFENETGAFEPVGESDRGNGVASSSVGDFGNDVENDTAWCVVNQLGTFAVGITDDTLPAVVEADDLGANGLGGDDRGICGAVGTLGLMPMLLGLVALRPRIRGRLRG